MERNKTLAVRIGDVMIGSDMPVRVQSMCNTFTSDVDKTVKQILALEDAGCEIVRVAVPDMESVNALQQIRKNISIPLVADIHFDYRLAIKSLKYADKIRINPGNIGGRMKDVVLAAKDQGRAIRIGVNSGSLEKEIRNRLGCCPKALVESARTSIKIAESCDFYDIVVSLKSSNVLDTIDAYMLFSQEFDYPTHIGITEAGPLCVGLAKSAVGIGHLLLQGIGDTIRVSLTEDPEEEVNAAYEILRSVGLRKGRTFISCPTCGRTGPRTIEIAKEIEKKTRGINKKIAVMGCEVNGPGEARDADVGIAFCKDKAVVFKKGKVVRIVNVEAAVDALMMQVGRS